MVSMTIVLLFHQFCQFFPLLDDDFLRKVSILALISQIHHEI